MKFRVLKKTASGNLLLQSDENKPLERKTLFANGKRAALVFDTIASTKKPFYLAKPLLDAPKPEVLGRRKMTSILLPKVEGILVDSK